MLNTTGYGHFQWSPLQVRFNASKHQAQFRILCKINYYKLDGNQIYIYIKLELGLVVPAEPGHALTQLCDTRTINTNNIIFTFLYVYKLCSVRVNSWKVINYICTREIFLRNGPIRSLSK